MSVQLMHWLKSPNPLKSLYFVIGTEHFLISEIKKAFVKSLELNSDIKDFNQDELDARELPVGDILAILETLPFMAKKRLVFCYNAEFFKEEDWEKLEPILSKSLDSTVFVCFFEKKDGRKKHFKTFKDKTLELSAEILKPWEISPWFEYLCKKENLEFHPVAKTLFQSFIGNQLKEIQMELQKLKHYLGENRMILEKDVLASSSRLKKDNVFELTEAIGNKDIVQALNCLAHLLEQNQNEIGVLSLVSRHIRILSRLKKFQKQKLSKVHLAGHVGISPYFLKNYLNQSELWSEHQIERTMEALFETDKALKSSPLSSHIFLENFILKVCSF